MQYCKVDEGSFLGENSVLAEGKRSTCRLNIRYHMLLLLRYWHASRQYTVIAQFLSSSSIPNHWL